MKRADIVIGIPSYNEAQNIAFPTMQAALGLKEYFGHMDSVIIDCDNCSSDGTGNVFMNTDTKGIPKIYLSTPKGVRGKGNNIKNLFRKALELNARAVIMVDADLQSITPRWIKNLGEPLFNDFCLCCAPVRKAQVRRTRHLQHRLSPLPMSLRPEGTAAHRRGFRVHGHHGRRLP